MTLIEIIHSGDRLAFKAHVTRANDKELIVAWIAAAAKGASALQLLAFKEMERRQATEDAAQGRT